MNGTSQPPILTPDESGIARAVEILRGGGLVALPTETVYGLAARADSADAVAGIYRAKGRPSFNPLIVHVSDIQAAARLARLDERAKRLASAFWPGALTMVLRLQEDAPLASAVTAGLGTVALRCPAHPVMQAVLHQSGVPLAAPSANRSGAVSPTSAEHVRQSLGNRIDAIVDGGACAAGIESTIVALRGEGTWQILRPGPIPQAPIRDVLGAESALLAEAGKIEAPGQLASHYAPGKPVRLNASTAESDEFHIGFSGVAGDINLSVTGDLAEAAARLYFALHMAASSAKARIAVAPIPDADIGAAINDRLGRAAA